MMCQAGRSGATSPEAGIEHRWATLPPLVGQTNIQLTLLLLLGVIADYFLNSAVQFVTSTSGVGTPSGNVLKMIRAPSGLTSYGDPTAVT